jgi:hypothetical protein
MAASFDLLRTCGTFTLGITERLMPWSWFRRGVVHTIWKVVGFRQSVVYHYTSAENLRLIEQSGIIKPTPWYAATAGYGVYACLSDTHVSDSWATFMTGIDSDKLERVVPITIRDRRKVRRFSKTSVVIRAVVRYEDGIGFYV